uniref:Uncharacterized protein n=1 Tax=Octopus bimaculoides TaxID=37653 RepID=A0A0L8HTL0_OCTBM
MYNFVLNRSISFRKDVWCFSYFESIRIYLLKQVHTKITHSNRYSHMYFHIMTKHLTEMSCAEETTLFLVVRKYIKTTNIFIASS